MINKKCEHLNATCDECGKKIYRGVTDAHRRLWAWDLIEFMRTLGYEDALILYKLEEDSKKGNEIAQLACELLAPLNTEK